MGWFFESENDKREKRIISYAEIISKHVENVAIRCQQDGGVTYANIKFVASELSAMMPLKEKLESEITQLPQSRVNNLRLPWSDGVNYPFHLWAMTYQMVVGYFQNMINEL